jgi:uncharacterized protein
MAVLIDTSFLVAAGSPRDTNHILARRSVNALGEIRIVPEPVLPEMFYMLTRRVGYTAARKMFHDIRSGNFQIEPLTNDDMTRMDTIMSDYADNEFDFVDVALMAMAERLDVCEIYTFDHRDFMVYRPPHCDFFELLP